MEIIRSAPIIARAQKDGDPPDDGPYWRRAEISNDEVDSHITQFHISSLQNFEKDASEGVGILVRHKMMLPVGNTRNGELTENRVLSDISVVRGEPLIGDLTFATTDGIIRQIEAGVIKALSVGASGGIYECNICGVDMAESWDWDHWPGKTYLIENDDGKKEEVRCIPLLKDYHLDEVSLVHAGSNPDALIMERSKRMLEEGKLNRSQVDYLNKAFRLALPIDKANDKVATANTGWQTGASPEPRAATDKNEGNMPTAEELQQEVENLQKQITEEVETLQKQITEKDTKITELESERTALQLEIGAVRKEVVALYKEVRGEDLDGEQLTKFENQIKNFDLEDLKKEANMPTAEELQQEVETLQKQITEKDTKIKALEGDSTALQTEMTEVRKEIVARYKKVRGDDLTGEQLTKFENRIENFDLEDLKEERDLLRKIEVDDDEGNDGDDPEKTKSNQKTKIPDPNINYQDLLGGKERSVDRDL